MQNSKRNDLVGYIGSGFKFKIVQITPNRDDPRTFFVRMDINDTIVKKIIPAEQMAAVLEILLRSGQTIDEQKYW